jgi:2-polyprenyl-3-methyl-5-hydroxy-6-metoxy-1,4-benzoquinol methylase
LWKETYNILFPEKVFDETNEHIRNILKIIDIDVSSALDLCCNPGRCSIVIANKGFPVTGADLSTFLLDNAKVSSKSQNLDIK